MNKKPLHNNLSWLCFFIVTFIILFSQEVYGQQDKAPHYEYVASSFVETFGINTIDSLPLGIETTTDNKILLLTVGEGIGIYDFSQNQQNPLIPAGQLNEPLDFSLDTLDNIYVANRGSHQIKIFNSSGNALNSISTGSFSPYGIAIFSGKIFSLEYNDNSEESRLRLYDLNGNVIGEFGGPTNHPLDMPYRIDVTSTGKIFIAHVANDSEILVLDEDFNYVKTIQDIESPGNIIVDNFDFVHIVDYSGYIEFSDILNEDIPNIYLGALQGIQAKAFKLKVFDEEGNFLSALDNSKTDVPLDFALAKCGEGFMLNANIDGFTIDVEIAQFQRSPSFDVTPPQVFCVDDFSLELDENGKATISVEDIDNGSTDNCGIASRSLSKSNFTTADVGDKEIILTVKDENGNLDTCTTIITIINNNPPTVNCRDIEVFLDENGSAQISAAQIFDGDPGNLELSLDKTDFDCNDISDKIGDNQVQLTVTGANGISSSCIANVKVKDTLPPTISCLEDQKKLIPHGEGYILPNYKDEISVTDNCSASQNIKITQNGITPKFNHKYIISVLKKAEICSIIN